MENQSELNNQSITSLSSQSFEDLLSLGLDLNHLFVLENPDLSINNPKLLGWKQTLVRKGYLSMEGLRTPTGDGILAHLHLGIGLPTKPLRQKRAETREKVISDFDRWWDTYPSTDSFTYKGKQFRGTRSLRINKAECMVKFGAIIDSGKYTAQEMIDALIEEKKAKMEESIRTRHNEMSWFSGTLPYLNQGKYEGWIQAIRDGLGQNFSNDIKRIDI